MNEQQSEMSVDRFEGLVAPHLQVLYGFACRRLKNASDAEDLVQDTLIRAWGRLDTLKDLSRIRPWLFTILVNLHAEQARKQTRRRKLMPVVDLDSSFDDLVSSTWTSPLDEVIRQSATAAVRAALEQVPSVYAIALEMRDLEGLSYKEIARALEIPEGTAMSRVGRGRKLMASLLVEWHSFAAALAA